MSDDDEAVRAVVKIAQDERADPWADPRWEQLADGSLSAEGRAALEAEAARDPAYAEALRAFAPLSAGVRAKVLDAVLADGSVSRAQSAGPVPSLGAARERRRAWAIGASAAALAVAAALALVWSPSPALAPLPAYALELSAGAQAVRGEAPEAPTTPEFLAGTTFELVLRPAEPARGPVSAAGVLVGNGLRVRWSPSFQRSDDGALRVRGPARDVLPVGPGVWAVLVAVGRPADVERAARALELSDEAPADVHVLRTSVRVAEPRP